MRRTVIALVTAMFVPIAGTAHAEPAGSPFEVAREAVSGLKLAPSRDRQAVAHWAGESGPAARLLGTTGALGGRMALTSGGARFGSSAVAFNPRLNQYLHVFTAPAPSDNFWSALFGQLLDGNGNAIGDRFLIYEPEYNGVWAAEVLYNPRARQYFVTYTCCSDEYDPPDILAQLVDESGNLLNGAVVSREGDRWKGRPHTTLRRRDGSYLVVWHETDWEGRESQIHGQLVNAAGMPVGPDDFVISRHSNLVGRVQNVDPRVAVDPETNEAIVVWSDQYEVFGRRIGADGLPVGPDLWLSRMGPPSDPAWLTMHPDIAYNPTARQYLVVWQSGPRRDSYPAGETIYGQHLDAGGRQIGSNDFAIATLDRALEPAVTALGGGSDFMVAWKSERASTSVWARRVTATVLPPPETLPEDNPTPDRPPINEPVVPIVRPDVTPPPATSPPSPPPQISAPPAAAPPPTPARSRSRLTVSVIRGQRLTDFARRGLRVRVQCGRSCEATARLVVSRATARKLGSRSRVLVRATKRTGAGTSATVTLRPSRGMARRLLRLRRLDMALRVTAVGADQIVRHIDRRVKLRR